MKLIEQYGPELIDKFTQHILISSEAIFWGILVGISTGLLLVKTRKLSRVVIPLVSFLQTIPSLAMLALMIPFFGIGKRPAVFALFLYSLLPIMRNTLLALQNVSDEVIDSAKGMGMTFFQRLRYVDIPISLPTIIGGIRVAAVYIISWTTLASYTGAGGLGDFIFNGLNLYRLDLILLGTIPVTLLALTVDLFLQYVEEKLRKKAGIIDEKVEI